MSCATMIALRCVRVSGASLSRPAGSTKEKQTVLAGKPAFSARCPNGGTLRVKGATWRLCRRPDRPPRFQHEPRRPFLIAFGRRRQQLFRGGPRLSSRRSPRRMRLQRSSKRQVRRNDLARSSRGEASRARRRADIPTCCSNQLSLTLERLRVRFIPRTDAGLQSAGRPSPRLGTKISPSADQRRDRAQA
jgi:hypothetical protein